MQDSLPGLKKWAALLILTLLAVPLVLCGCLDNLCTKRLYIYRDAEPKSLPPAEMALLIADPAIVSAVLPGAAPKIAPGLPWAPEQPNYASDFYRLSIDEVDGRGVYQGLCMNVTPTDVCEVRPGARRVTARLELMGPGGREGRRDTASLPLEPGGIYFLHPDWDAAAQKVLKLQVQRLPAPYTAAVRAKLIDWLRGHTQGRSLEN
jgi:hypothetical protein